MFFNSDKRFEFRIIQDMRVRNIEIRLYLRFQQTRVSLPMTVVRARSAVTLKMARVASPQPTAPTELLWIQVMSPTLRLSTENTGIELLSVSYPSVTEFSAILFLLFARSSSNSPRSFQRFRRTLRQNFNWIRQQIKNNPIDTNCNNRPLSAT